MDKRTLIDTLLSIRPGAHWSWTGDDYADLIWLDDEATKPTAKELGL